MTNIELVESCLVCHSSDSRVVETTSTMMGDDKHKWSFRECEDCNMVALSPRVPSALLNLYYTESYLPYRGSKAWGRYAELVDRDQKKIDNKRLKTILKYSPLSSKSILDIGCGKPSFLKLVHEQTSLHPIGLDFNDEGWKDDKNAIENLDLHVGTIEDLQKTVQADIITMWHYLEHDYSPGKTLKALSQSQKKDSVLIIEVPNYDSYTRKKYGKYWAGYHTPRHTGLYTPDTMKNLLESNGWHVVDQYSYGTLDPYVLDWMSRMEKKNIDWTDSMEPHFVDFVLGKILRPKYFFDKHFSLGFMTVIAQNTG